MKKIYSGLLMLVICCLLIACKKDAANEMYEETVPAIIPDFTNQVTATVQGFIFNELGEAIEGASVTAGSVTILSDENGYFRINNVSLPKTIAVVEVKKTGYFNGYRSFTPVAGKKHFVQIQMVPQTSNGNFSAGTGSEININGGAIITIPANAMVIQSGGAAYLGTVNIAAHWFNPADMEETNLSMPGDLRGIDSLGHLKLLTTFGMIGVELTGSAGEPLQLSPGSSATIQFPIPSPLMGSAPGTIPLWHFDERKGVWIEEGTAVKTGNFYKAEVTHFSYWNADIPNAVITFVMQVLDEALNPLPNIPVSIEINGTPNSARTDFTNSEGFIGGFIPANSNLRFYTLLPCGNSITLLQINTSNLPVNLGSVKINFGSNAAVYEGTVKNCSGLPVNDGYVVITGGVTSNILEVSNGNFSAAGIVCNGANATVIAFDRSTGQQSLPANIPISTGNNNLGNFTACTASATENIYYELDGAPTTLTLPQHLFDGNYNFASNTTTIKATDLLNGNAVVFNIGFDGGGSSGSYPVTGNLLSLNASYQFISPVNVTVSNYGLIGEYIIGTVSGTVKNLSTNINHTFTCTFNIKRDI